MSNPGYYALLEIQKNAPLDEIKKAYKKLAKITHPDKVTDENKKKAAEEKFKVITAAYEVLSDKEKRAQYDKNYTSKPSFFPFNPRKSKNSSSEQHSGMLVDEKNKDSKNKELKIFSQEYVPLSKSAIEADNCNRFLILKDTDSIPPQNNSSKNIIYIRPEEGIYYAWWFENGKYERHSIPKEYQVNYQNKTEMTKEEVNFITLENNEHKEFRVPTGYRVKYQNKTIGANSGDEDTVTLDFYDVKWECGYIPPDHKLANLIRTELFDEYRYISYDKRNLISIFTELPTLINKDKDGDKDKKSLTETKLKTFEEYFQGIFKNDQGGLFNTLTKLNSYVGKMCMLRREYSKETKQTWERSLTQAEKIEILTHYLINKQDDFKPISKHFTSANLMLKEYQSLEYLKNETSYSQPLFKKGERSRQKIFEDELLQAAPADFMQTLNQLSVCYKSVYNLRRAGKLETNFLAACRKVFKKYEKALEVYKLAGDEPMTVDKLLNIYESDLEGIFYPEIAITKIKQPNCAYYITTCKNTLEPYCDFGNPSLVLSTHLARKIKSENRVVESNNDTNSVNTSTTSSLIFLQ